MTELLLRMFCGATLGLALVLLVRRPVRRVFGAGPAFTLWLLPVALMLAPLLPQDLMPAAMVALPGLTVTPHVVTA
ncbi:MAG TPA: peptidase M56, partial [Rhodanobacteraceae bacterium]|nr:peptidase M56 [Rhodanobacteraceae bacterium]